MFSLQHIWSTTRLKEVAQGISRLCTFSNFFSFLCIFVDGFKKDGLNSLLSRTLLSKLRRFSCAITTSAWENRKCYGFLGLYHGVFFCLILSAIPKRRAFNSSTCTIFCSSWGKISPIHRKLLLQDSSLCRCTAASKSTLSVCTHLFPLPQ